MAPNTFVATLLGATIALSALQAGLAVPGVPAKLFGMSDNVQLETFDTTTGVATPLSKNVVAEAQAQQLSAIDVKRDAYYIIGWNETSHKSNLIGLSLTTGAKVTDVVLPFYEPGFVGVGQDICVEPLSGKVIASGRLYENGPHAVGLLDPVSGAFEVVASLNKTYLDVLGGSSAYDPLTKTAIVSLGTQNPPGIDLFAVNIDTKKVTKIIEDPKIGHNIDTLNYDSKRGLIVGLGFRETSAGTPVRTIVTLDPATLKFASTGDMTEYGTQSGSIAALDVSSRHLYWIGQKAGANATAPFYLVAVDVDTATVIGTPPQLCANDGVCPWSLEFANPV